MHPAGTTARGRVSAHGTSPLGETACRGRRESHRRGEVVPAAGRRGTASPAGGGL